jgi:molybdate/tungstate transport system permease protein
LNLFRALSYISLLLLISPVLYLLYEGFGPLRNPLGYSSIVLKSIELTVFSSALAAIICFALFTPLAYSFARNKDPVGETFSDIVASVPHPVIGIAILFALSPLTPLGKFLTSHGVNVFDSMLGLVLALVVISAPFYVKSMQPFFQSMSLSYERYALGLGASRPKVFFSVVLPNARRGILSASLIAMSRAMSEFGSIVIIAYAVFNGFNFGFYGTSPASVLIYNLYEGSGPSVVATASALMISVSVVVMVAIRLVNR